MESWVTTDFGRPEYERVNGRPLIVILSSQAFIDAFGGATGARRALALLRDTARKHGLPDVYVVGSGSAGSLDYYPPAWIPTLDGIDALTAYTTISDYYIRDPWNTPGPKPFSELIAGAEANWELMARLSRLPYLPPVTLGWDPRPAGEPQAGRMVWFERRPADVEALVRAAVAFVNGHPRLRTPGHAVVLLQAWNELSEGAYLVPTTGAGHEFGSAVARALGRDGHRG